MTMSKEIADGFRQVAADQIAQDIENNSKFALKSEVATGVQSDWNETDTTALSYIKNKPTVPSKTSELTNDSGFLTEHQSLDAYAKKIDLATVATTGAYSDLSGTPTIPTVPTKVSAFENDSGYLTTHQSLAGYAKTADLATVATSGDYADLSGKPTIPTVPTKVSAFENDAGYLTTHQSLDAYVTKASLSAVATSGSYEDLTNKPSIPEAVTVDSALSSTSVNPVQNKIIKAALDGKQAAGDYATTASLSVYAKSADLADVATSGSYTDLSDTPTIPTVPTNVSAFQNDAGYLTQHQSLAAYAKTADLATVATSGSYTDLANKPTIPTVPTVVSAFTNDAGYLTTHQDLSAYAKTANLATVATSGSYDDLLNKPTIPAVVTVDSALSETSTNPVQNKIVKSALDGKQASGNYVTYSVNSGISFGEKTNQTTYRYGQSPMVVAGGIIIGGSAASAGLVTRGICGVTSPNSTTGACEKSQLYINYDGENSYSRSLVLGAGSEGNAITASTATTSTAKSAMGKLLCAIRGDQMVNYVNAKTSDFVKSSALATVATTGSYNDLTDKPESGGSTSIEVETLTVTDASSVPTFSMTDVVAVVVFVDSVLAREGETYGITEGTTLTFSQTMPVGTQITVYKFVSVGSVIPTPSYSIDSVLSTTSTNAVQNKVVTAAINEKADEETVSALQASIDAAYAKYVAELES